MKNATGILYLTSARLPTEKAHGFQIVKMCEAFTDLARVKLVHPHRRQPPHMRTVGDIWSFYDLKQAFEVSELGNLDVVRAEKVLSPSLYRAAFFLHSLLWGLRAAIYARKEKAQINYTRDVAIAYWLTRIGLPTIFEAHSIPARARLWLFNGLSRSSSLLRVVALTSFLGERLTKLGILKEKIVIAPDAVDPDDFANLPSPVLCRKQLGLPTDSFFLGYVGQFQTMGREKGIPDLIRALAYFDNGRSPHLLCVGGPLHLVPGYLKIASREGISADLLTFIDYVPQREVRYWIRSCNAVAIPFPAEQHYAYYASPLKLFEYMASGVPIIASRLPSLEEILVHEHNALLVEPDNPEMLAGAVRRLRSDPELGRRLAEQARQKVASHTWRSRAVKILDALPC